MKAKLKASFIAIFALFSFTLASAAELSRPANTAELLEAVQKAELKNRKIGFIFTATAGVALASIPWLSKDSSEGEKALYTAGGVASLATAVRALIVPTQTEALARRLSSLNKNPHLDLRTRETMEKEVLLETRDTLKAQRQWNAYATATAGAALVASGFFQKETSRQWVSFGFGSAALFGATMMLLRPTLAESLITDCFALSPQGIQASISF